MSRSEQAGACRTTLKTPQYCQLCKAWFLYNSKQASLHIALLIETTLISMAGQCFHVLNNWQAFLYYPLAESIPGVMPLLLTFTAIKALCFDLCSFRHKWLIEPSLDTYLMGYGFNRLLFLPILIQGILNVYGCCKELLTTSPFASERTRSGINTVTN